MGAAAMARLRCFDGIPFPYDLRKRMVVPDALKTCRMKEFRKFCELGELAHLAGWQKGDLISKLEDKRKEKSAKFHQRKDARAKARAAALGDATCEKYYEELKQY